MPWPRQLERVRQLEVEIERDVAVELAVPDLIAVVEQRTAAIAAIARELEREWAAQGPLVVLWTRAAEQLQLAESAGVDPEPYRAEVAAAERRVESARLETRDHRELLEAERSHVDDGDRTPAGRDGAADRATRRCSPRGAAPRRAGADRDRRPGPRTAAARARTGGRQPGCGSRRACRAADQRRISSARSPSINARLPAEVELPANAPPSMEMRLRRVGIAVTAGTRE